MIEIVRKSGVYLCQCQMRQGSHDFVWCLAFDLCHYVDVLHPHPRAGDISSGLAVPVETKLDVSGDSLAYRPSLPRQPDQFHAQGGTRCARPILRA
ncbi:MAG TPA: hypothetical protein VFW87_00470 [Pirellulales bacterium]|nr:hypothetical protein [Pirellulales bacterium]